MAAWTEKDYEGCDTPRTVSMLIQRGCDPRSKAPFVEFTRGLEREANELRKALEKCANELKALTQGAGPAVTGTAETSSPVVGAPRKHFLEGITLGAPYDR